MKLFLLVVVGVVYYKAMFYDKAKGTEKALFIA